MQDYQQWDLPPTYINANIREYLINQRILEKTKQTKQQIQAIIKKDDLPQHYYNPSEQKDNQIRLLLMCLQKDNSSAVRFNNYETYSGNIIKQILHVNFSKAVSINLNSNQICNIQDLQFLVAQNMATFQLYDNHITKIGPLFKNNWLRAIKNLTLHNNKIKQVNSISRAMFPNLVYIEIQTHASQNLLMQDLLFAMKLQSKIKLPSVQKRLWCASNKRIKQPQFQILNKYNAKPV